MIIFCPILLNNVFKAKLIFKPALDLSSGILFFLKLCVFNPSLNATIGSIFFIFLVVNKTNNNVNKTINRIGINVAKILNDTLYTKPCCFSTNFPINGIVK